MSATPQTTASQPPFSRRRYVGFAMLAFMVAILSVDIFGAMGTEDPRKSAPIVSTAKYAEWVHLDENGRHFLNEEYESVVAEVRSRIEYEHALFVLKFTLVGGTLYLLFQLATLDRAVQLRRTDITALIAWSAVIVATLVDLRVMANQSFLVTLGGWVRQYEALRLDSAAALGWEAYLADNLLSRQFYPVVRFSAQALTTLLFWATAGIFLLPPPKPGESIAIVTRVGAVMSIAIMTGAAISLRQDTQDQLVYLSLGLVAASTALALAIFRPKRQ